MLTRAGHDLSPVDEHERRALGVGSPPRRPFVVELLAFLGLGLAYLLLLPATAWYPVYLTLGDTRWWMFVVNSVAPYLFLPVPVVLIIALLARRWALLVAALIPTAVFLMLFGQSLLPRELKVPSVPPDAPSLSLLTYNLHAWNTDVDGIVTALLASDADVRSPRDSARRWSVSAWKSSPRISCSPHGAGKPRRSWRTNLARGSDPTRERRQGSRRRTS